MLLPQACEVAVPLAVVRQSGPVSVASDEPRTRNPRDRVTDTTADRFPVNASEALPPTSSVVNVQPPSTYVTCSRQVAWRSPVSVTAKRAADALGAAIAASKSDANTSRTSVSLLRADEDQLGRLGPCEEPEREERRSESRG